MPQASVSSALHDLAGRSATLDDVVRFAAQDLIYVALIVALAVWLRPQGLRAGVAATGGALLVLGAVAAMLVWLALGVALPLLGRLDGVLQRLHLRPRAAPVP